MLSYDERAKYVLRLLSTEFHELVERMISQKEITPEVINKDLINQMSDLVVDIEGEKTESVTKIKDYIKNLNDELVNREYYEQAIEELGVSNSIKDRLRELLYNKAFTEQQYRLFFSLLGNVVQDIKASYEADLEAQDDELIKIDKMQHSRIERSKHESY